MNSYYKATTILREILEANEDVNTVLHGKSDDKDLYKKSIYPLAHINPVSSSFDSSQANTFTFEIAVLDQRDLSSNSQTEDKFYGNANEIDNLNTAHSVLNDLLTRLRLNYNDGLEVIGVSPAQPVLFKDFNLLDGWLISLTVTMPNDIIDICNV